MAPSAQSPPDNGISRNALLILDLRKQHVSVNYEQPSITIGRDAKNRIVINHPKVSRIHARIDMTKNAFVLTDQSTNGTYIHPNEGDAVVLKKEKCELEGEGIIYAGKAATPDSPNAIHYHTL